MQRLSGGCQCGRIRYRISGGLFNPHICHCRMCQRAHGNFFAALVSVSRENLTWLTHEPEVFHSSEVIRRGFCKDCGTPLTYDNVEAGHLSVSIGSLDDPSTIVPEAQYGVEGRLPAFPLLHELPASRTEDDIPAAVMVKLRSRQFQP